MWRWGWLDETCVEIFLNEFLQSLLFKCWQRVYRANQRLSTLFQIDFEVWKGRVSALVLLKTSANLWYLEETLDRSGVSAIFAELAYLSAVIEDSRSESLLTPNLIDFSTEKNLEGWHHITYTTYIDLKMSTWLFKVG